MARACPPFGPFCPRPALLGSFCPPQFVGFPVFLTCSNDIPGNIEGGGAVRITDAPSRAPSQGCKEIFEAHIIGQENFSTLSSAPSRERGGRGGAGQVPDQPPPSRPLGPRPHAAQGGPGGREPHLLRGATVPDRQDGRRWGPGTCQTRHCGV